MKYFIDLHYFDPMEIDENSEQYKADVEQIHKLGKEYKEFLNSIKNKLPKGFLDIYEQYYQFEGLDMNSMEFDHSVYNHPSITIKLTTVNMDKIIILKYFDVQSFTVNLMKDKYFHDYQSGYPASFGVNEFLYSDGVFSHEISFYSTETIFIEFKRLEYSVIDKVKTRTQRTVPFVKANELMLRIVNRLRREFSLRSVN